MNRNTAMLIEIAQHFGVTLELNTLLDLVLTRVTELFEAERALFALADERGEIEDAVVHNLEWSGPGSPLPVSTSFIRDVITRNEVLVVQDTDPPPYGLRDSVRVFGIRFMIGVPIPLREAVVGVIYIDSFAEHRDELADRLELISAIAHLVGTAIENARLFEEQRYRTWLLASLVHDFRSPLQVIDMNARLMAREDLGPAAPEMLRDIEACSRRLSQMATTTLALARMDMTGNPHKLSTLALADAIAAHVRKLKILAQSINVSVRIAVTAALDPITTSNELVTIILDNLLLNALKHARAGSTITVRLGIRLDAGPTRHGSHDRRPRYLFRRSRRLIAKPLTSFVEVSVHNEGTLIRPDRLRTLFTQYATGEGLHEDADSAGLGLSIVNQCVQQLGGKVWAESTAEAGTTFVFTMPTELAQSESEPERESAA